jgi:ROS/MUCR transcriptional regulator protein
MEMNTTEGSAQFIELATDIVSAYVSNNSVGAGDLPILIKDVYGALSRVTNGESSTPAVAAKPAVSIKKSITPDFIICLEDGKKFKSLKRHLRHAIWAFARAIPREVEPWLRLPDGRAQLCGGAFAARQADGSRPAAQEASLRSLRATAGLRSRKRFYLRDKGLTALV